MTDIGESLVGAYLRHIVGCRVVVYNSFFSDRQGEVDVVGMELDDDRTIWLCEVTTHIGNMDLRRGSLTAEDVIDSKLGRLRDFAESTFPGDRHRFEWWSPRVGTGLRSKMNAIEEDWKASGRDLQFVTDEIYTERIEKLADDAKQNQSTTNEPAYRLLQVLARLRGNPFSP